MATLLRAQRASTLLGGGGGGIVNTRWRTNVQPGPRRRRTDAQPRREQRAEQRAARGLERARAAGAIGEAAEHGGGEEEEEGAKQGGGYGHAAEQARRAWAGGLGRGGPEEVADQQA